MLCNKSVENDEPHDYGSRPGERGPKQVGFDNLPSFPEAVWQTDFEVRQDKESNSYMAKVRDKNVTVRKITAVRPKGHRIRSKGEVKISAILKDN